LIPGQKSLKSGQVSRPVCNSLGVLAAFESRPTVLIPASTLYSILIADCF
jgi:hypothetical protein